MGVSITYDAILQQLNDAELEDEYDWHRGRQKHHQRRGSWGLASWHRKHCSMLCDEIGVRSGAPHNEFGVQLALDVPGRIAPEAR